MYSIKKRLGYPCINLHLKENDGIYTSRHIIQKTFLAQKDTNSVVSRLALDNVKDLVKIIQWNERNGIKFYRMSSSIFPWMSEYELSELPDWKLIKSNLRLAGKLATDYGQRLEFHPGPFNVLGSMNSRVVDKTIKELNQHAEIFDSMGLKPSHWNQINIHLNTTQDGKENSASRFIEGFNKLNDSTKARLVVENDDKPSQYSVSDLYELLHKKIRIPITFDSHHHKFCSGNMDHETAAKLSASTWPEGIPAGFHYSATINHESLHHMPRAHADWIYDEITDYGTGAWIMCECKMKEKAILKYVEKGKEISEFKEFSSTFTR